LHRARDWSHRGRGRRLLWQAAVVGVGFGLILAGLAMLVLPGPGWAAIILGLVVLASEYAWAHRVLQPVRRVADRAAQAALDPERRQRNLVVVVVALVVAVAVVSWYLVVYGVSLEGLRWLPGL
jgi:uncharacterized protein (TIGR02611 family)